MPENKDNVAKDAATKQDIQKAHAASGRPVSPTEDPTDHSAPATELARQVDPQGRSGATVNAESMERVQDADERAEAERQKQDDNSLAGKIRRSKLMWVNDHSRGGGPYVGISPSLDEKADYASKTRSLVEPLDLHSPRTGLEVRLEDGTSFTLGDEFGMNSTPGDWARVKKPDGELLFA